MAVTRRRFLQFPLAAGLLPTLVMDIGHAYPSSELETEDDEARFEDILQRYVDALIPADSSPGAVMLGVPQKMLLKARMVRGQLDQLQAGCELLDRLAQERFQSGFERLAPGQCNHIIGQIADTDANREAQAFFRLTQHDAFAFFYSHPASWQDLAYPGPPQPAGFMDHDRPPAERP